MVEVVRQDRAVPQFHQDLEIFERVCQDTPLKESLTRFHTQKKERG
jgi:hypothetical protein